MLNMVAGMGWAFITACLLYPGVDLTHAEPALPDRNHADMLPANELRKKSLANFQQSHHIAA